MNKTDKKNEACQTLQNRFVLTEAEPHAIVLVWIQSSHLMLANNLINSPFMFPVIKLSLFLSAEHFNRAALSVLLQLSITLIARFNYS